MRIRAWVLYTEKGVMLQSHSHLGHMTMGSGSCTLATIIGMLICYAQDERTVRLGAFECDGGSDSVCLATAASGEE